MTDEQLGVRVVALIRLYPDLEEQDPTARKPFARMTDRQIVTLALREGWIG